MQTPRRLISAATVLAATAVAWHGGSAASAQEPGASKPRPDGEPAVPEQIRVFFNRTSDAKPTSGATAIGDVKASSPDESAKPAATAAPGVRLFRAQAAKPEAGAQLKAAVRPRGPDDAEMLNLIVRIQPTTAADPHRVVLLKLKAVASESCVQCHAGGASIRRDDALGLTLVPADETLRSQLKLDGQGLVVTAVAHGSSGESGGVKEKDILIECAGKRLASVDDFGEALKAIGAGPMPEVVAEMPKTIRRERIALKLVRAGEMKEVAVPPPFPPTVVVGPVAGHGAAELKAPSYWIGVSIDEVDDTLREHLKLGEGVGLVVSDVLKDSPAAKVGLEKNDILLRVDGKPLKAPDDLVKAVQSARGGAILHLRLRHAGAEREIAVRPEKRKEPEPTAAAPASPFAYKELRLGDGAQTWVTQIVPFLDAKQGNMIWATPAADGQAFVLGQIPPQALSRGLTLDPHNAVSAELRKANEATRAKMVAEYERLIANLRAQEADRKAMTDWVKKAAVPGETLARIDAQLKALETQVGEIKRSMDELKAAIKKDAPR